MQVRAALLLDVRSAQARTPDEINQGYDDMYAGRNVRDVLTPGAPQSRDGGRGGLSVRLFPVTESAAA